MASRIAYTMKLKPNAADEYKRRHDEIWPEVITLLHEHGIHDFSIFHDELTSTLFVVYRTSSIETASNDTLRQAEVIQRWWKYMADLVEFNDDETPMTHPLKILFHMD